MKKTFLFIGLLILFPFLVFAENELTMKKNDILPYYYIQIKDSSGPFVLTGYNVYFSMRKNGDAINTVDKKSMNVTSASEGYAEYRWTYGDTANAGIYFLEITVENAGNTLSVFTLPAVTRSAITIKNNWE